MNDRFEIPDDKPKQELPKSLGKKCALLYALLVKDMIRQGVPHDAADMMATAAVEGILGDIKAMKREAQLKYNIYSTVFDN